MLGNRNEDLLRMDADMAVRMVPPTQGALRRADDWDSASLGFTRQRAMWRGVGYFCFGRVWRRWETMP